MKEYNDIKQLIDRFFEGETSLEEEQKLYDFYSSHLALSEDLEEYRDMFADIDAIAFNTVEEEADILAMNMATGVTPAIHSHRKLFYTISSIAAAILICFGIFTVVNEHEDKMLAKSYEGSYVIVKGERIEDLSRIKPDIEKALCLAKNIERQVEDHSVIKDAEQNVLDNIENPREKARIQQLLNE